MARTPLLNKLIDLNRLAGLADKGGLDYAEALTLQRSRRQFLGVAAAGAALAISPLPGAAADLALAANGVRIAVIGAGLAGLACAYELKKAGFQASVYEAATRLGGRCHSNRSSFPGQVAENGGELIDTPHVETLRLAKELGLQVDDLLAYDKQQGGEDLFWIANGRYTLEEAFNDFKAIQKQLDKDVAAAPFPTTWDSYTQRGYELDNMTVTDWINRYVPGGMASRLGKLLDIAYEIKYGAACSQQSALNLVYLIGYSSHKALEMFGGSDERYHIRGGNDQLVSGMAARLAAEQIKLEHELKKIVRQTDGRYTLTFSYRGNEVCSTVEQLVLAIPFSILRHSVDYQDAGFDSRKRLAIETMPMGNSAKFQLQFTERLWRQLGSNGATYSDSGYQDTWEVSRAQPGTEGILNNFTGGATAVAMNAKPMAQKAQAFLDQLEKLLPRIKAKWNGRAILNHWPSYKWTRGAYGYYAPGNYTRFVGYEGTRQGNCHFCGEHTSLESQGYLNGAIETGQRCAEEIKADLKYH